MDKFQLKDLLVDIDYQKISYEKRAEWFNKYGYSTNIQFFVPIYHLSNFIISFLGYNPNNTYQFGHGKSVLDKKLFDNAESKFGDASQPFKYKRVVKKEYACSRTAFYFGGQKTVLQFWLTDEGELTVRVKDGDCSLPKVNVYEKIEEWLSDFDFK